MKRIVYGTDSGNENAAFFVGENTQQRRSGQTPTRAKAIGLCDPNGNGNDEVNQPGGNRWPVGNRIPDEFTTVVKLKSPFNWKSLYNENELGSGSQLRYVGYDNEFVGTEHEEVNGYSIDAFGDNDPGLGNTNYVTCTFTNPGQYYIGQTQVYYNGCFEIPDIYFPRPGHSENLTTEARLANLHSGSISVQPNPANNQVLISCQRHLDILEVEIVDLGSGKIVNQSQIVDSGNSHEMSVSHLANGVYNLRIKLSNGQIVNGKVVVIH